MSPIIDLQRRVAEVGRIRIGTSTKRQRNGREVKVPQRLSTFRLTSPDRARLEAAAELYGGTVQEWEERRGEYVLDTTTNELPVVVTPGGALSQWWETWSGGECKRRCDGERETLGDTGCKCPADYTERRELAAQGKACKPTTRLNVILRDVPGVGYWRFESHGFYAAVELAGALEVLEEATRRGVLLPARLRFAERVVVRGGQTSRFPVPSLDVDVTVGRLAAIARGGIAGELVVADADALVEQGLVAGERPALEAGSPAPTAHEPAPARAEGVTPREGLEAVQRQTKRQTTRSAEPIGKGSTRSRRAPLEVPAEDGVDTAGGGTEPDAASSVPAPAETPRESAQEGSGAPESTSDVQAVEEPLDEHSGPENAADVEDVEDAVVVEAEELEPAGGDVDPDDPFPGEPYVTQAQAKLVHIRAGKAGVDDVTLDAIILDLTGGRTESAKRIPRRLLDDVLASIAQAGGE